MTLRLSSNMIGNEETNFFQKLLLTGTQVTSFRNVFANNSSANIKFSKPKLSKIIQFVTFLGKLAVC